MAQHYVIRTRATRANMRATGLNAHEMDSYSRHAPWLQAQIDAGVMLFVGRTALEANESWAMAVIKAGTEEEARAIMMSDPFVIDGVAIPELIPLEVLRVEPQNL